MRDIAVFSGSAHRELAVEVCSHLGVPLHPTQLYEAGAEAIILGLLLAFEHKGRPFHGRTFWGYMLVYGLSRFVIEFFRGDLCRDGDLPAQHQREHRGGNLFHERLRLLQELCPPFRGAHVDARHQFLHQDFG